MIDDYKLIKSDYIVNNHAEFVDRCDKLHTVLKNQFPKAKNTTWIYYNYNIFICLAGDVFFYNLYKELTTHLRHCIGDSRPAWFSVWLNYLTHDQIGDALGFHDHPHDLHGFISIDPKDTITEFVGFEIDNQIGNIYIGPGGLDFSHKVVNRSEWEGNRITLGFDVSFEQKKSMTKSFIPLL